MSNKKGLPILIGDSNRETTELAKKALDEAKIEYRFAGGVDNGLDGPMPQLSFGLNCYFFLIIIKLISHKKINLNNYFF